MEAEVIASFLPRLITAISDCVQPMSDQCLAKGLIPDSVYKRVLESGQISEDKARTLVLAVKTSIETDSRCFDILLNILEEQLPLAAKQKLLSEIRKELIEKSNICREVVPSSQVVQPNQELPRESDVLQTLLLTKFEESIRQHEHACAEKSMLEEKLKAKSEEYETLKHELEAMKCQTESISSIKSSVTNAQSRLINCGEEIESLKARVTTLEHKIEEQGMKVKRGRSTAVLNTRKMLVAQRTLTLTTTLEKAYEEMRKKERELNLTIQEKDLRIKELELEAKQQKKSSQSLDMVPLDIIKKDHIGSLHRSMRACPGVESAWQPIAVRLGFTIKEIDRIRNEEESGRHLFEMLNEWVQWYPGDRRGSTTFPIYSKLVTAIVETGYGDAIQRLIPYNELSTSQQRI